MKKEETICYTCKSCKINSHGYVYCSLRKRGEQCINYDKWESQKDVLDKIRAEVKMEKLEDSPNFCVKAHNNAVDRVLQILDKYKVESEDTDGANE